ncbi:MAG: TolC family protein [Saprospiraceae bacterium]|nr:TolC family protein [Saprospiraceae bacterium]
MLRFVRIGKFRFLLLRAKAIGLLSFLSIPLCGQVTSTSLDSCLAWADNHTPLTAQQAAIAESTQFTLAALSKQWLPQLTLGAQMSHQSDVTKLELDIPGFPVPAPIARDQYKVSLEGSQLLWDGGILAAQKSQIKLQSQLEQTQRLVDRHALRGRIIQLYFGMLLIEEQLEIAELFRSDLEVQLSQLQAASGAGVVLESNLLALRAEIIAADQRMGEIAFTRRKAMYGLSILTGRNFSDSIRLQHPPPVGHPGEWSRSELVLSELQASLADAHYASKVRQRNPKLLAFLQAGYANPALNFLKPGFDAYYLAGIRAQWNLQGFYTIKEDRNNARVQGRLASLQRDLFVINNQLAIRDQQLEMERLAGLAQADSIALELRRELRRIAGVQLRQGVATSADYIRELNAEARAESNARIHQLSSLQAQYLLQHLYGTK